MEAVVAAPSVLNVAVITVLNDIALVEMISEDLREWGMDDWDWQLQQLSPFEFVVVCPSRESLKMVSKISIFVLPVHKLMISVREVYVVASPSCELPDTMVLFEDVLSKPHRRSTMMAFGELLGKPIAIDVDSLPWLGPVRAQIWCKDPSLVAGSVEILPTTKAFHIRVWAE